MRLPLKIHLKRLCVAAVVSLQLNTLAFHAWADSIAASAALGNETGRIAIQDFDPAAAQKTLEDLFPDLTAGSTTTLEDVYGNDSGTISLGLQANTRLQSEASMDGEAYRTLIESGNRTSVDLSNDPMFNQTDKIREPDFMTGFKENFADCKRTDVFEEIQGEAHVANYKTCERVADQGGSVRFTHDYKVGVVEYVSGQPNYQSCGVGCLYIWVGTVGDNYWRGTCQIYEEYTRFRVINKDAIISAVIEQATFDDYFQIYFNENLLWTHTPGVFPPETPGACERGTSWRVNPNQNVTAEFKSDGDVITFKTRTSVTGGGEGYARIRITYDPHKAFLDNGWGPEERLPMFGMINDGFCTNSSVTCSSMPSLDANGCITENGVVLCQEHVVASPHPNLNPFCKVADVSAECSFYKGDMECYIDAQGVERCPTNEGGNLNSCAKFEEDSNCGFISQKCVKGAEGDSGGCYAFEEVWDCGYDVTYPTVVNTGQQIDCPGGARCMGSECFDTSNTKSNDFAYAVAMLQVAQFAEHDLDCGGDGTDIETANDCKIFKGEAMECKKALGGYVDCCEAPDGVSIFDYVNLTMNTLKMASATEALAREGFAKSLTHGYWQAGTEAITSVGSSVVKGEWGSIVDSATSAFQSVLQEGAQEGMVSMIQEWLMQQAYDAMVEMGATTAANAVFATGSNGAVTGLSANAAMVVNIIGWVYMVYVIVDLLINIIWECEEKEFELGAKKETRQCHFVGSYCASKVLGSCVEKRETYCCFGSVVARIIQESARDQLGLGWGTDVENPSCEGITPDQMAQMDWDKVDLSEWIGMLSLGGRLPTADTLSLEHLTGEGSRLEISAGDVRLNALDRNVERLKNFDADEVKKMEENLARPPQLR